MKVVVNLDANTSDTFNLLKGEASIGAFAAACIKQQLEFLKGSQDKQCLHAEIRAAIMPAKSGKTCVSVFRIPAAKQNKGK